MSIIETVLHANLGDMFQQGKQTLVVGSPKCLSLDTEIIWKKREGTTWRNRKLRNILHKEGIVRSFNSKTNTFVEAYALVKPSGKKLLYEMRLKNDCTVKASLEHKFFVSDLWNIMEKKLSELKLGDDLVFAHENSKIVSIEKCGEENTADLIVPELNNFCLSNGILTHNSGKTSLLLYLTATFHKLGEYVIVRDIGEYYEWFSMLDLGYKIKGFVPKGCKILFEHPNFEQVEFDITDMNTFFDQVEKNRINLIFFESFSQVLKNHVKFWVDFFTKILPWKEQPGNGEKRFCIIIDEFGDIAPGKGRTYIPGQSMLSQLIAVNHRKFRRHNIRLIAAVHLFRDITFPIRTKFDCFCIRNNYAEPKELPFVLENYANVVTKLPVNKMLFVDSGKNFNEFEVKEEIKPIRFYDISVQGIGVADELMQEAKPLTSVEKYRDIWRQRTALLIETLTDKEDYSLKQVADLLGLSINEVTRIRREHLT